MCKKITSKARIASAVFLVAGLAGMVLGFGPLAYEPTSSGCAAVLSTSIVPSADVVEG